MVDRCACLDPAALNNEIKSMIPDFENKVLNDEMSSFIAAYKLLNTYYDEVKKGDD